MIIRKIQLTDAEDFLNLCKTLDKESKFMMLEPDERKTTIEAQTNYIKNVLENDQTIILVCEVDKKIVGYISATRGGFKRIRHSAYIVIGILQQYIGKGIGTKLFTELENWCISNNIHRLELTVMSHNHSGVALYKKMGFEIEGTKKHSMLIDGEYLDEYYMAKLL